MVWSQSASSSASYLHPHVQMRIADIPVDVCGYKAILNVLILYYSIEFYLILLRDIQDTK